MKTYNFHNSQHFTNHIELAKSWELVKGCIDKSSVTPCCVPKYVTLKVLGANLGFCTWRINRITDLAIELFVICEYSFKTRALLQGIVRERNDACKLSGRRAQTSERVAAQSPTAEMRVPLLREWERGRAESAGITFQVILLLHIDVMTRFCYCCWHRTPVLFSRNCSICWSPWLFINDTKHRVKGFIHSSYMQECKAGCIHRTHQLEGQVIFAITLKSLFLFQCMRSSLNICQPRRMSAAYRTDRTFLWCLIN